MVLFTIMLYVYVVCCVVEGISTADGQNIGEQSDGAHSEFTEWIPVNAGLPLISAVIKHYQLSLIVRL